MQKENVTTTKLTMRVHPLTYGHLVAAAHLKASCRKASVSRDLAELLDGWAKHSTGEHYINEATIVPEVESRVQVMACVQPETMAVIHSKLAAALRDWKGQGEQPSISNVAGKLVDQWFFSDYRKLPYKEGDKLRRLQQKARAA